MNKNDSLLEWNKWNIENTEHNIASELFINMTKTSPLTDRFSLWLFAGTGATGALLITNIQNILPNLTLTGFRVCISLLVISAILAFFSKYWALRCQIQTDVIIKLREDIEKHLTSHKENESRILDIANENDIHIDTEIEFDNVIKEFSKPFPIWARWLINRNSKKNKSRLSGHHAAAKAFYWQVTFAFLQSLFFIAFLCSGGLYASGL